MATTTQRRTNRTASPERWQKALARALAEGVQVRQMCGSGAWLATSGTDATRAYELAVVNGIPVACACPAGETNDPVCKHRARYYNLVGLLDLAAPDPEPEPPAPAAPAPVAVPCWDCGGTGAENVADAVGAWHRAPCLACEGTGIGIEGDAAAGAAPDAPGEPDRPAHPRRVECPACRRTGYVLQDKPLPAGWRCVRCRTGDPPAPPAPVPFPSRAADLLAA